MASTRASLPTGSDAYVGATCIQAKATRGALGRTCLASQYFLCMTSIASMGLLGNRGAATWRNGIEAIPSESAGARITEKIGSRTACTEDGLCKYLEAEWLEADGLGGFVSGRTGLLCTRSYHSLSLASARPYKNRIVLANGIEAWVVTGTLRIGLTAENYLDGAICLTVGYICATSRSRRSHPGSSCCRTEPPSHSPSSALATTPRRCSIGLPIAWLTSSLGPLFSGRDYHALHHHNDKFGSPSEATTAGHVWCPHQGMHRSRPDASPYGPMIRFDTLVLLISGTASSVSTMARIWRARPVHVDINP